MLINLRIQKGIWWECSIKLRNLLFLPRCSRHATFELLVNAIPLHVARHPTMTLWLRCLVPSHNAIMAMIQTGSNRKTGSWTGSHTTGYFFWLKSNKLTKDLTKLNFCTTSRAELWLLKHIITILMAWLFQSKSLHENQLSRWKSWVHCEERRARFHHSSAMPLLLSTQNEITVRSHQEAVNK